MNPILDSLNGPQTEAVKHFEGPMLVMAGAGSGKTKVLTHRIAYLIEEKNISPYNILAITFTNKAAREMKERVIGLIGDRGAKMHISTFHSFCVFVLRQDIDIIGYRNNFVIYDDDDSLSLIKKLLADFNLDAKHYPPKRILSYISNAKNDYIFPADYRKLVEDEFSEIVYKIYEAYQDALMKANALDFDDLIMLTIRLFERSEETLNYYQQKFQFILVDEYQDTNKAQFKLVSMLSAVHRNIFAVGDSDQSIYSWRGADIRNILDFEKDFLNSENKVKMIYLEQNYRSIQNILDVANSIIKNNYNSEQYIKKLWSERKKDVRAVYYRAVNSDVELEYIAQKIKEKVNEDHYALNDIAILYRTNALSLGLEKVLSKYKIDYEIYGNVSFFDRKEIKDFSAYLRLIVNRADDIAYLRVVNEPRRGIGNTTLEELKRYGHEHNLSLYDAARAVTGLSARAKESLLQFNRLIDSLESELVDIDMNDYLDLVLEKTEYLPMLVNEATPEANNRIENLEEFKSLTLDIEEDIEDAEMTAYDKLCLILNNVSLASDKSHKKENAVKLMTIHAAKGLEFPVVFLYGVEESIFPLGGDDRLPDELHEERRLMYVAVTRAKDELFITNSEMRKIYGNYRMNGASRFIDEIDRDLLSIQGVKKFKRIEKKPPEEQKPAVTYTASKPENGKMVHSGSKILHERFGEGVVIHVSGDICTIAFSAAHGIKKLDINHPAITVRS